MVVKSRAVIVLLAFVSVVTCQTDPPEARWPKLEKKIRAEFPRVRQMSVSNLSRILHNTGRVQPIILDVRAQREFDVSHLPGAILAPTIADAMGALSTVDRSQLVVAYCSVGYRSSRLASTLQDKGFTNVFNLEGSIFEWANSGHPVVRNGQEVHGVHPFNDDWGQLLRSDLWQYRNHGR